MKRLLLLALLLPAAALSAQSGPGSTRRATNVAALLAHSTFFHQRAVTVVGELTLLPTGEVRLTTDGASVRIVSQGNLPDGPVEVRGEFWDLGKFSAEDPRLVGHDLKREFGIDPEGPWPKAGQVTALIASSIVATTPPAAPSIRNLVLFPGRYVEQKVTLVGQFGGRNLLGDLPEAPGQSRWDFVLRSADAAIWVTNLRPKGKDFELALDAKIDTGRWLEVSGTLQQGRGLQWLNGDGGTIKITAAPKDAPEITVIRVAPAPPPDVVFSAPTGDETDVLTTASVRIQFSRDMDPATFKGHIRVSYASAPADAASLPFTTSYMPGMRVLELKFPQPLDRLSQVRVDLQDGIVATDKQALAPWTLTFETGNQ
jgi:hypothetical protein